MTKNLKLNIKNTQLAKAVNLDSLKSKLAKKVSPPAEEEKTSLAPSSPKKAVAKKTADAAVVKKLEPTEEEPRRIRAKSRSAFSTDPDASTASEPQEAVAIKEPEEAPPQKPEFTSEEETLTPPKEPSFPETSITAEPEKEITPLVTPPQPVRERSENTFSRQEGFSSPPPRPPRPQTTPSYDNRPRQPQAPYHRPEAPFVRRDPPGATFSPSPSRRFGAFPVEGLGEDASAGPSRKAPVNKAKEFKDIKTAPKRPGSTAAPRSFDSRDRHGLRAGEEEHWRKKRSHRPRYVQEETVPVRPTSLKIRLPISVKDLASEMKLKASQLISKLFMQGVVLTLNDLLDDETTIQLLGQEFGCELSIDSSEEERIRITGKTIREEVRESDPSKHTIRAPVVTFMGHVDHGKTSLIDSIRKSNRVASEAGAITQHIGAFRCKTAVGYITILDTPGHEAFSAMRARGAEVTDIVVLVVAGDEGIRQQTLEAMQQAKDAGVTIIVAINKCDKPGFNAENVYRQLADQNLLPETWGGTTITVNCSAVTGEGVSTLLEMLALQAEVLELKADPTIRARGSVLESEMHTGRGAVATVLVQNGTLHRGDALVFNHLWGRVKTMHDENGLELEEAGPSTPIEITGLSGVPEAGHEFIVVKSEREAREIAEARKEGHQQTSLLMQKKRATTESMMQQQAAVKKTLNLILRADVQGSLEALKTSLVSITSDKVSVEVLSSGVGAISESDVELAQASKAVIIGFHTKVETHAEGLIKQNRVDVRLHEIIYHAIDDVKKIMTGLLDKISQERETGQAIVKTIFKASHLGIIAGCQVTEGSIIRNHLIRVVREGNVIWKGTMQSLRREKEDAREVKKGLECGIFLQGFNEVKPDDILQTYEIFYISQEL